jgi:DNA-binding NtrC family response regulator
MDSDPRMDDQDKAFTIRSMATSAHPDPYLPSCHYGRNGNLFLHDSFDLTDPRWGMKCANYPEQPVIVGRSTAMLAVFRMIAKVAPTRASVLIQGPSGAGKELVAMALASKREGPFQAVNCAMPTDGVSFEDTLFGRVDKVMNGASAAPGAFQLADTGTILLDNIECLSLEQQAKLLRVLESQLVYRLGSPRGEKVNVRLICATNRDLPGLVDQGRFREDLYYRIKTVRICLPPLHARTEDIPLLTAYFFLRNLPGSSRRVNIISSEALERLCSYDWPGNVRELAHVVDAALVLSDGPTVGPDEFDLLGRSAARNAPSEQVTTAARIPPATRESLTDKVVGLLQEYPRVQTAELARLLGCSQRTVQRAIRKLVPQGRVVQERDGNDPRVLWYRKNGRQD